MELSNFILPSPAITSAPVARVTIGPKERLPSNVTLHRSGEVIQAIEVRCACGEKIVIQCVYE
jgi:hypothetical protein